MQAHVPGTIPHTQEGLGNSFGTLWGQAAALGQGGGVYRMGGLGFGLPLSRLYARYFGKPLIQKVLGIIAKSVQARPMYISEEVLILSSQSQN